MVDSSLPTDHSIFLPFPSDSDLVSAHSCLPAHYHSQISSVRAAMQLFCPCLNVSLAVKPLLSLPEVKPLDALSPILLVGGSLAALLDGLSEEERSDHFFQDPNVHLLKFHSDECRVDQVCQPGPLPSLRCQKSRHSQQPNVSRISSFSVEWHNSWASGLSPSCFPSPVCLRKKTHVNVSASGRPSLPPINHSLNQEAMEPQRQGGSDNGSWSDWSDT